jgi:hypothetical protein
MAGEFNIKNGFKSNGDSTVSGKLTTQKLTITSGATNGYVLTSDSSGNAVWGAPSSSSGVFGIANTSGVYTYYATLTIAMSAATSGQTIEMFADITESSVTAITLKNGVNINGNGHTYNYTAATGNCFIDNGVAVECSIISLIVNRTSHTSGNILTFTSNSSNVDYSGSKFYLTSASSSSYVASLGGTHRNLWVKGTGTSLGGITGGVIINCYGEVTGTGHGIYQLYPNATDCTGISGSGNGFLLYENGTITRCFGKSSSSRGIDGQTSGNNIVMYNCIGISSSGLGINSQGCKLYNCIAISSSSTALSCAFGANQIYNTSAKSASGAGLSGTATDIISNCSIISDGSQSVFTASVYNCSVINTWNNANGHAYTSPSASSNICNNFMSVTNTSANCIYNASAVSPKYANNAFKGATTPINANITQAIVNTQDNQGNILL